MLLCGCCNGACLIWLASVLTAVLAMSCPPAAKADKVLPALPPPASLQTVPAASLKSAGSSAIVIGPNPLPPELLKRLFPSKMAKKALNAAAKLRPAPAANPQPPSAAAGKPSTAAKCKEPAPKTAVPTSEKQLLAANVKAVHAGQLQVQHPPSPATKPCPAVSAPTQTMVLSEHQVVSASVTAANAAQLLLVATAMKPCTALPAAASRQQPCNVTVPMQGPATDPHIQSVQQFIGPLVQGNAVARAKEPNHRQAHSRLQVSSFDIASVQEQMASMEEEVPLTVWYRVRRTFMTYYRYILVWGFITMARCRCCNTIMVG